MYIPHTLHRIFSSILLVSILCAVSVSSESPCNLLGPCPKITLPYGTWEATSYNKIGDFYTFKNIRFGQAPVGDLRFARSVPPADIENPAQIQDSTYGHNCIAISPKDLIKRSGGGAGGGPGTPWLEAEPNQGEDCLFLDLYVPRSAINSGRANIPVVVWFYGGAFLFGSKSVNATDGMLYSGTSVLDAAHKLKKEVIFVTGNYRLGAFGWLAGSYMESNGVPNAGLTDQRLLLEWVRDHISLVGGDKSQVSAWGESAGGGSILHHLIANGGETDPLFQKAILQSAAYYWAWDRTRVLNKTYTDFARLAECEDIKCLRAAPLDKLKAANFNVAVPLVQQGKIPFGPAVDGILVKDLPSVEFQKGHYWRKIDSLILSHVVHESDNFVPKDVNTVEDFNRFITSIFPSTESSVATLIQSSPLYSGPDHMANQAQRLVDVARDAFFTGNILQLFNAYQSAGTTTKVYVTEYGWLDDTFAVHASDLIPTFFYPEFDLVPRLEKMGVSHGKAVIINQRIKYFSKYYKQYLVSHALSKSGNPNEFARIGPKFTWNPAIVSGGKLSRVPKSAGMNLNHDLRCTSFKSCFEETTDAVLSLEIGEFWDKIAMSLSQPSSSSDSPSSPQLEEVQLPLLEQQFPEEL